MKVAVLPSDWNWKDAALVELDLQMRRDHRRDYSFINFLLALDESVNVAGADNAAKAFRLTRVATERNTWILAVLRDLVDRSRTEGSIDTLNLRDFEADQGKLEELFRTYTKLYKEDPTSAEALKENRLLALLLDKSKTDLRHIGDTFASDHLAKTLPVELSTSPTPANEVDIPGLGVKVVTAPAHAASTVDLVTMAAKAKARTQSEDLQVKERAAELLKEMNVAVDRAITAAGREDRLKKSKTAAIDKLTAAADTLESSIADIAEAKSKGALDEEALNEALVVLEEVIGRLGRTVLRVVDTKGDGFDWLERGQRTDGK
jgi:hypothetical protein